MLSITAVAAVSALQVPFVTPQTVLLGACASFATALALILIERALADSRDISHAPNGDVVSPTVTKLAILQQGSFQTCLRDIAAVVTIATAVAAFWLESFRFDALTYDTSIARLRNDWRDGQARLGIWQSLGTILILCSNSLLLPATVRTSLKISRARLRVFARRPTLVRRDPIHIPT